MILIQILIAITTIYNLMKQKRSKKVILSGLTASPAGLP